MITLADAKVMFICTLLVIMLIVSTGLADIKDMFLVILFGYFLKCCICAVMLTFLFCLGCSNTHIYNSNWNWADKLAHLLSVFKVEERSKAALLKLAPHVRQKVYWSLFVLYPWWNKFSQSLVSLFLASGITE